MKQKPIIGIYKITSPSKKVYIGQSKNIKKRFKEYSILNCKKQPRLHKSFLKYGFYNHIIEIVCQCEVPDLNDKERYYQELYSVISRNGLNCILQPTDSKRKLMSDETKLKIGLASLGRKHTEETKNKIRESKKYLSEETRLKLSLCNKGKVKTKEHIEKIKLTKSLRTYKPIIYSEERRLNTSKFHKGKKMTDLQIEKMAATKRKLILNLETGIFYYGVKDAAKTINMNVGTLNDCLLGRMKNKTKFRYV